ncbi:WAT1-related protein At4g30420-like [Andrographis paniculata]|uniref:WAT1-related protein At4g30420-like n=1 Tax=Andrographis paniculata TaxID=175694 RepID=UPI0021E7026E|nr:WAT1-related protein At4g30420-like [Andrographis paniculata]
MKIEIEKEYIVMVGCQLMYAATTLTTRYVLLQEMSSTVFVTYRQSFAFFLLAPFAFFPRRGKKACALGWKSFGMIFMLSLIGATANQNIYSEGLYLTTSSAASALSNLTPAVTFLLAYTFGLEKVNVRSMRSVAKIGGTVLCVSGAAAMTLLRGQKLLNNTYSLLLLHHSNNLLFTAATSTWLLGCLLVLASTFCWSFWLILQPSVSAQYPDHLALTAWMCLIAAVQTGLLTALINPGTHVWKLDSSFQLFSCCFAGLSTAVTIFGQTWCVARRGPLFSASFSPLCTVIVTLVSSTLMHEELYTWSIVGGLIVIVGLYIVLWGKAKEHQGKDEEHTEDQLKTNQDSDNICGCTIDLEEPLLSEQISAELKVSN